MTLALASLVQAAETTLTADPAGDAETAADGTGSATITLDPDTGEACWELSADGIGAVGLPYRLSGQGRRRVRSDDEPGAAGTASQ